MNQSISKRALSIVLCMCFIILSGCGQTKPVDTLTQEDGSTSSTTQSTTELTTETTVTTTSTTTTTTTTKTEPTTEPETQESESEASTKKTETSDGPKLIALTFDDGPHSAVTARILNTLEKHGAKATFFVVGNRVGSCKSVLKRAHNMGCEIGSHTWSHKNLSKLTVSQMQEEMKKSADAISAVTGVPVKIMRPPEGGYNDTVKKNIQYPMIMWSVDSNDWKHRDAKKDYDAVMNTVFDGAIILMHDLYPATAEAVEKLVPDLMAKGYKFVTVSELMEARGYTLQNGKTYSQARPK